MSYFDGADPMPLQDFDDAAEIPLLRQLRGYRMLGLGASFPFNPIVEERSAGTIVGSILWRDAKKLAVPTGFRSTGRPLREVPSWSWAFPAIVLSSTERPDGLFSVRLLPVGDAGFAVDERYEVLEAVSSAPCTAGLSGTVLAATDERSQQNLFFPTGSRLSAPHFAGSAEDGSLVFDDGDKDRRARLQTLTRPWIVPSTCGGDLYGRPSSLGLALQIGISKGGVRGVLADGGNGGPQRIGGLSRDVAGPFHVPAAGDKHQQGTNSDGEPIGPVELSSDAIWHLDGERDAPFLFSDDLYEVEHGVPGVPQDVELVYDPQETHPTPCGAKSGRFRWQTRVPFVPVEEDHPHDGGGGGGGDGGEPEDPLRPKKPKKPRRPGRPVPQEEEHFTTPQPQPGPGASTPPPTDGPVVVPPRPGGFQPDPGPGPSPGGGTLVFPLPPGGFRPTGPLVIPVPVGGYQPEPVVPPPTDGPVDDEPHPRPCATGEAFLWFPNQLGLGSMTFVPQSLAPTAVDLRHSTTWGPGELPKGSARPPSVLRADVLGTPRGLGFKRTTTGSQSKSPTGTGVGGLLFSRPEVPPEDVGNCNPPNTSESYVGYNGIRVKYGKPNVSTGKIVEGWDEGKDEATGDYTIRCLDTDGGPDPTDAVRIRCENETFTVWGEEIVEDGSFRHPPGFLYGLGPIRTGSPVVIVPSGAARDQADATNIVLPAEVQADLVSNGAALGNDSFQLPGNVSTTIGTNVVSGLGGNSFFTDFQPRALEAPGTTTYSNVSTTVTGPASARWLSGGILAPKVGDLVGLGSAVLGGYRTVVSVDSENTLTVNAVYLAAGVGGMNVIESPTVELGTIPAISTRVLEILTNATLYTVDNAPSTAASTLAYAGRPLSGNAACDPVWFYPWLCKGPSGTTVFLSTQRSTPYVNVVTPATYGEAFRRLSAVLNYADGGGAAALYSFSESGQDTRERQWEEPVASGSPFAPLWGADPVAGWSPVSLHRGVPPTATVAILNPVLYLPLIDNQIILRRSGAGSATVGRPAALLCGAGSQTSSVASPVVTSGAQSVDVGFAGASPGDPCAYLWVAGYLESLAPPAAYP